MLKNQITGKINLHSLLIVLIIFCVFEYGIQKICGYTLFPDEFGYWASAASAVGYDWSEVASLGSYYSFGYSLILIPVLKFISDGVMAYRAAIFINMLLMCVSIYLFGKIIEEISPKTTAGVKALISGAAVLYPAWIFYMQMTMTEAVLCFMFSLDIYLFCKFMEKQKVSTAIALAAALIYGYCVHMRTIGVVIACVLVYLCKLIREKGNKKLLFIWFGVFALLSLAALYLKNQTIANVFSHAEQDSLAINDYGNQWGKLFGIFTAEGMKRFACGVVGELYYLGLSSFGTFYWAMFWCIKESVSLFKVKKDMIQPRQWLALFLLLAVMGQVLISSIYIHNYDSIDCIIYGRYNELFVPVTILIGILAMSRSRRLIPVTILSGTALGGITLLLLHVIKVRNMSSIRGYHIVGISYLLKEDNVDVQAYFWHTWMLGFGFMLLVCVFIWLGRRWTSAWWMYAGILIVEIAIGLRISDPYTYTSNYVNFENLTIAEMLQDGRGEGKDILYLEEGTFPYVEFLQMQIPKETIHVIREDELSTIDSEKVMVLAPGETELDEVLREMFDKKASTSAIRLYYNQ